jgi:hypothetical protein
VLPLECFPHISYKEKKLLLYLGILVFGEIRNYRSGHFLLMPRLRMLAWYLTCSSALYISPTLRLGVLEIWVALVARLWPRACVLSTNMSIIFRI